MKYDNEDGATGNWVVDCHRCKQPILMMPERVGRKELYYRTATYAHDNPAQLDCYNPACKRSGYWFHDIYPFKEFYKWPKSRQGERP